MWTSVLRRTFLPCSFVRSFGLRRRLGRRLRSQHYLIKKDLGTLKPPTLEITLGRLSQMSKMSQGRSRDKLNQEGTTPRVLTFGYSFPSKPTFPISSFRSRPLLVSLQTSHPQHLHHSHSFHRLPYPTTPK